MKKISMLLIALIITCFSISMVFARAVLDSGEIDSNNGEPVVVSTTSKDDSTVDQELPKELDDRKSNASKTTLNNLTSKDKQIQEYTEKLGGNRTNGTVLYYLHVVQSYSIPVCFVGIVIASLNFFIIGNKKLEKRESGFKMLVTLIIGLIVFQVLPLLFAIVVAGR